MSLTPSMMLPLGTPLPEFSLPDASGKIVNSTESVGQAGTLVMFISNHCPYVKNMKTELAAFAREIKSQGIATIAVNSNDVEKYPADSPENMAKDVIEFEYSFPYLFDESQAVAKAFQAACTPDFYLFDATGQLVYRGQFDGSRPGNNIAVSGNDMRRAVDALLGDKGLLDEQIPSVGCNIKWRAGNEPSYFA